MMKHCFISSLFALALFTAAAAPVPPGTLSVVGAPTNGFWLTNITFVYTNTAIRTPTIDLDQVTVYGSNTFKTANVLSWNKPASMGSIAGFKLYYGRTSGGATNTFKVNTNITSAAFYSSLATNVAWWAYVTSYDTNTPPLESVYSSQITFTPTK